MKIAITGDAHLTMRKAHPERWRTFENMLRQIAQEDINKLIIAGDLFHEDYRNYSEFDELTSKYEDTEFHIIPGNHDSAISQKYLTGDNVIVYREPKIVPFEGPTFSFLFLPYKSGKTMGEEIATFQDRLKDIKWILISHGDWSGSLHKPNPSEPGVYMPLSRRDIDDYEPALTILGHIHEPLDDERYNVHYVGSPCGLDITETGRRRCLILNTENLDLKPMVVNSEIIYFSETITIYPMEDERKYLEDQIKKIRDKWSINSAEKSKVQIRIKVQGYSSNKRELQKIIEQDFSDLYFYNNEGPDVSAVDDSDDYELLKISNKVLEKINQKPWQENEEEPDKNEIVLQALQTIYNIR